MFTLDVLIAGAQYNLAKVGVDLVTSWEDVLPMAHGPLKSAASMIDGAAAADRVSIAVCILCLVGNRTT